MTTPTMDALDPIRKQTGDVDVDYLRQAVQAVLHAVMDADVYQRLGAGPHEHTPGRGFHHKLSERQLQSYLTRWPGVFNSRGNPEHGAEKLDSGRVIARARSDSDPDLTGRYLAKWLLQHPAS